MQLRDDEKAKPLLKYIAQNKAKHRGVLTWVSEKTKFSYQHIYRVSIGKVVYNQENFRVLRSISNRMWEIEEQIKEESDAAIIELSPVLDSPMRA